MTWWKKILTYIPLLVAGYEVGKATEGSDNNNNINNKQLIEFIHNNEHHNNEQKTAEHMNFIELMAIAAAIILAFIYLSKLICKFMMRNNRNIQQQI